MKKNFILKMLIFALLFCLVSSANLLLAAPVGGEQVTDPTKIQSYYFWKVTVGWGEDIIAGEGITKGNPWYKKDTGKGLPIQREGQITFAVSDGDTISENKSYADAGEFLEDFEAEDSPFGGGGVIDFGDKDLTLEDDIDLGGANIKSISDFAGVLDGQGHSIKNFKIDGGDQDNVGFIKNLSGTVKNLVIENAQVSSTGKNIGVLAGNITAGGEVIDCLIKDSKVKGFAPMGMVAGTMTGASCTKVLLVNDTLMPMDTELSAEGSPVGGLIGSVGDGSTLKNCVSMLDMFYLKMVRAKSDKCGRVYGSKSATGAIVIRNYGWVETGFRLWDDEKDSYFYCFYPNWTKKTDRTAYGTSYVETYEKHGYNLFTGDYYPTGSKSVLEAFWKNSIQFDLTNIWDFPSNARFPVPRNSSVDATDLIPRRGFESDEQAYNAGYTNEIGTANMFSKTYWKNLTNEDGLFLGTDIQLTTSRSADAPMWAINPRDFSYYNFSAFWFAQISGVFNGLGHQIMGLSVKNQKYGNTSTSGVSNDYGGFINSLNNGEVTRLALSDFRFFLIQNTSLGNFYLGAMAGSTLNGGEINNCFVDIEEMYMSLYQTPYYVGVGGLVGYSNVGSGSITNNIVSCGRLVGGSNDRCFVGGLVGNCRSDVSNNYFVIDSSYTPTQYVTSYSGAAFAARGGGYLFWGKATGYHEAAYEQINNFVNFNGETHYAFANRVYEVTDNYDEVLTTTPDLWGADKINLDPDIWEIPTEEGKLPYLKKEDIVWVIPENVP